MGGRADVQVGGWRLHIPFYSHQYEQVPVDYLENQAGTIYTFPNIHFICAHTYEVMVHVFYKSAPVVPVYNRFCTKPLKYRTVYDAIHGSGVSAVELKADSHKWIQRLLVSKMSCWMLQRDQDKIANIMKS